MIGRAHLGWETFRGWLDYLPDGKLNIAHEAVDRHVAHGKGDRETLRWLAKNGERRSYSYVDLNAETDRFARLLADLGLGKGTEAYSLLGRVPVAAHALNESRRQGAHRCHGTTVTGTGARLTSF
jgi:acetyl-CoA synthetase